MSMHPGGDAEIDLTARAPGSPLRVVLLCFYNDASHALRVGDELGITRRRIKHSLPAPVNRWLFRASLFDRKDWNHVLLGECLKQLAIAQDTSRV